MMDGTSCFCWRGFASYSLISLSAAMWVPQGGRFPLSATRRIAWLVALLLPTAGYAAGLPLEPVCARPSAGAAVSGDAAFSTAAAGAPGVEPAVSIVAGTGVLLRLPQPAATVMSADPASRGCSRPRRPACS